MTLSLLLLSALSADVTPANVSTEQLKGTGGIVIIKRPKPKLYGTGGIVIIKRPKPKAL